jgi:SNF2 family DNA or RNA helicase
MMRHKQNQTYRGTDTTLMSLPPKIERVIEVSLSEDEKQEYNTLDEKAKTFYLNFRDAHSHDLSCHYLKLSQILTPMRVACSGGAYPLNVESKDEDEDEDDQPRKIKKVVEYSDFALTSKFKVLLSELERIRDEDPTSKSLVFSQYGCTVLR